jgi:hypothetical protein
MLLGDNTGGGTIMLPPGGFECVGFGILAGLHSHTHIIAYIINHILIFITIH